MQCTGKKRVETIGYIYFTLQKLKRYKKLLKKRAAVKMILIVSIEYKCPCKKIHNVLQPCYNRRKMSSRISRSHFFPCLRIKFFWRHSVG